MLEAILNEGIYPLILGEVQMLSEKTISIVKSTAPILQEHGETLTRHFYKRMFLHNPEVAPYFNPAHQAAGRQQKALAGAICAYAANIDNLAVLSDAVELIAQKHASLQIKPAHYPIVGENLLASIREVLGEGATDDVIGAWAEAYEFLASIFINREAEIYQEAATVPGGWEGFKPFRIARKEQESSVITSFYLVPEDGAPLPLFKPGQYVTVRVPAADGQTTMRNYSLSDKPGKPWLRISVKREDGPDPATPGGYVSNLLHKAREVGDTLEVAPPCGEFTLNTAATAQRPLVLLAAGVGVTPLMSMLLTALETMPEREILFIHGTINEEMQPFKAAIDSLAATYPNLKPHYRYDNPINSAAHPNSSRGFIDGQLIESMVSNRNADYYFCGPQPFMANIYHELEAWGVPPTQINFEFFGPRAELKRA